MKQFFFVIIPVLAFLSSCHTDPEISVTPQSIDVLPKGDTFSFTVSSDGEWNTVIEPADIDIIVDPSSGSGDSPVSIIVPATDTNRSINVIFYCIASTSYQTVSIEQFFPVSLKITKVPDTVDFAGGEYCIIVDSNYPWKAEIAATAPEGFTISSYEGEAGESEVTISIPAYKTTDTTYRDWSFSITAGNEKGKADTTLKITQMAPNLRYGNDTYELTKLGDGRIWMAENLRFLPTGKKAHTDFNDSAITDGVWYPTAIATIESDSEQIFVTLDKYITAKGYLYTLETALGVANGTINSAYLNTYKEGVQGICPKGWHLPTHTEMQNLVDKHTTGLKDSWLKQEQIAGMIKDKKLTGTKNTDKSLTMNTCYFLGSSLKNVRIAKNNYHIRSYGLKFSYSEGTISVTDSDIDLTNGVDGASIRCIMDQKTTK